MLQAFVRSASSGDDSVRLPTSYGGAILPVDRPESRLMPGRCRMSVACRVSAPEGRQQDGVLQRLKPECSAQIIYGERRDDGASRGASVRSLGRLVAELQALKDAETLKQAQFRLCRLSLGRQVEAKIPAACRPATHLQFGQWIERSLDSCLEVAACL